MRTLPCSPKNTPPLQRGLWAITAIACAMLLGGCSIWPKALTFGTTPEPVQAQTEPPADAAACKDCLGSTPPTPPVPAQNAATPTPLEPQVAVVTSPLPEPVKAEPPPAATAMPMVTAPERTTQAGALVPGFYINVGLFSVPTNGTKAYKELEDAGLPVFSDGIKTKKGNLTRVRVGPFNARAEADTAAKQIRTLKLDAVVFKH